MSEHVIQPVRETVHGFFSRELTPVATIDSGDSVTFKTLDAGWHPDPELETGRWDYREHVAWYDSSVDNGHALCGPVFVRGASPGMTLEIAIDEVTTGSWGWSTGGGFPNERNVALGVSGGAQHAFFWHLDSERGLATTDDGHQVRMRPFCGVMGMPPDEPGSHPTAPPRSEGGNIDCKELVAGTKLLLPVRVEGGLFSCGDGHGVQGDGEVSGVAIECPMERVRLTFTVTTLHLDNPRAWTPEAWFTLGFDADLDQAALIALRGMLDLMTEQYGISRSEALNLASLVVDLRVTQIVNGVKGVHAVLRHDAILGGAVPA